MEITFRPITDLGMQLMQEWFQEGGLNEVAQADALIATIGEEEKISFIPWKTIQISSDSEQFYSEKNSILKRRRQKEYNQNRKSE